MPNASGDDDGGHQLSSSAGNKEKSCPATLLTIFVDSFKILLFNPKLFSSIFLLFALPLSLLLSTLSLTSAALRRRITHLESLASIITVRIEALNILEEARKDAKSLFRLRASYAIPCLLLSTLILISSGRRRFSFSDVGASVWGRTLVTSVAGHVSLAGLGQLLSTAEVAVSAVVGPGTGLAVGLVAGALEIYLTAVFGMATMVSVVEERFGMEAIRVGSGLMAGKRVVGWAMMAAVAAATRVIGWEMIGVEEIDVYGGDWKGLESTAVIELGRKAGLVFLYGLVIVWSNVLLTVLYCHCRTKKVVAGSHEETTLVHNLTLI